MVRRLVSTVFVMILAGCAGAQRVDPPTPATAETTAAASAADSAGGPARAATAETAAAAASAAPSAPNEFALRKSDPAGGAPWKVQSTATEAALRFIVVDKDKGPIKGLVISLTDPAGKTRYTDETTAEGQAEVLVPVGQKYDVVFLSLGRRTIATTVRVSDEPKQNIKLTLRYKRESFEPIAEPTNGAAPRFVLNDVTFDTGKATIRPESFPRLDSVVEFMTYKRSARVEISGHTDNVGNPKANKALSEKRAQACRDYLVSKGVDRSRITAVGYGDERPIAANDSDDGRRKNRRIEATEL